MRKAEKNQDRSGEPDQANRAGKPAAAKMRRVEYEAALARLQAELVRLQYWIRDSGERIVVVFEGRDAAGKGGAIKRLTERVSPRTFRVVALPAPSERERSQIYLQRFIQHFPAAGEITIFDRSWYNRAGVEHVMGFCTQEEYERFLRSCPAWERDIIGSGIRMIKYWFDISKEEQTRRFTARINDPRKIWKLSPMDLKSHRHWYDYSRARDAMFAATHTPASPWHIVEADDKRRARLNCIAHFLDAVPYKKVEFNKVKLPKRQGAGGYKEPDYAKMVIKRVY
jgi:polyphosphate kinase 2